jgi:hypothetical protein
MNYRAIMIRGWRNDTGWRFTLEVTGNDTSMPCADLNVLLAQLTALFAAPDTPRDISPLHTSELTVEANTTHAGRPQRHGEHGGIQR